MTTCSSVQQSEEQGYALEKQIGTSFDIYEFVVLGGDKVKITQGNERGGNVTSFGSKTVSKAAARAQYSQLLKNGYKRAAELYYL